MSGHIQQIYTGFSMLHQRGVIDMTQDVLGKGPFQHLPAAGDPHLHVILNDGLRLHYDALDSWEVDEGYLGESDFYFKRSFSSARLENIGEGRRKIHPLGLNYEVYPSSVDRHALNRSVISSHLRGKLGTLARSLRLLDGFKFTPRVHLMEFLPTYDSPTKVLFMARAYDPYNRPDRPQDKVEERKCINRTRADCIRLLRDGFGGDFHGGFIHTDFAVRHYRELLLSDNGQSEKKNYIELLRAHPICVATTGLHGSIGWKFGEYVAFSKAIVSEKLNYEVPGSLEEGKNYLEFSSPAECVAKVKQLCLDRELRHHLMTNNWIYYQSYLRPEALVLNTLLTALSKSRR